MSVQVENLEKNMAKLTIEVAAEEVEKAIQAAYLKEKGKISMPGFRKGKVPRKMIEKMYGEAVFYEDAANTLIQENYPAAVEESGIDIVSRPTIDVVQIESGKPFIFTAEVAVRPEVKLGKYLGVQVTKIDTSVSDEEVEAAVEKERNNNARTVTVTDRPISIFSSFAICSNTRLLLIRVSASGRTCSFNLSSVRPENCMYCSMERPLCASL